MNHLMTDGVNSGLRLTLIPPGSEKVYKLLDTSPPDFLTKRSVRSIMGVSSRSKSGFGEAAFRVRSAMLRL